MSPQFRESPETAKCHVPRWAVASKAKARQSKAIRTMKCVEIFSGLLGSCIVPRRINRNARNCQQVKNHCYDQPVLYLGNRIQAFTLRGL
jgi:hypothetical protein